jgi:PKD repeat protein
VHNVAPHVEAGADLGADEGATVTPVASFTDPGSADTHAVTVDWGDGESGSGLQASHVYADDGTYTVTVSVVDEDGGVGSDTLLVTVRNVAPAVEAGTDGSLDEGGAFVLMASLSDPGTRDTHTVAVDWGDGSAGEGLTGSHRYDDNGVYTVTISARDKDGGAGSDSLKVTVRNVAPAVDAGPDRAAAWGVPVPLVGIAVDPSAADTAAGFTGGWHFGDGTESTNLAALHAYAAPGRYEAVLTVADKDGGTASDSVAVTIDKRGTRLVYTAPTRAPFGATVLSARLEDTVDTRTAKLAGRTIRFTLNGTVYSATTDATGAAALTPLVTGGTVSVEFAGDELYAAAQTQALLTVTYDFGGAGFFAIGDGSAALGAAVTFWDAQWWKLNLLGGGAAPSSFKGWVARSGVPACGLTWTTEPGNSAGPPATVPRYLAVAVTSTVEKSGSAISGNIAGIAVVESQPRYGPAPGHAGLGVVVARTC